MTEEKRMAGTYEILQAVGIGAVEVVIGESQNPAPGEKYMCGLCKENELWRGYYNLMVSDDYASILADFSRRITEETEKLRAELDKPASEGIDDRPVTAGFRPVPWDENLHGKVLVIRADVFKPEYRRATRQYQLCTGGFGASPHSRGTACYCTSLYTGKESRFERLDVLGIADPEALPDWAKAGLQKIRETQQERTRKSQEAR